MMPRDLLPASRALGRGLVFELPAGNPRTSAEWLHMLGYPYIGDADEALRNAVNDQSRRLELPGAAALVDLVSPDDERCPDLISVLTVLSKSSNRVYLRDKEPNLTVLRPGRRVTVFIPHAAGHFTEPRPEVF